MQKAIALIKKHEGLRLKAYVPPEGTKNGYAIGYGYTRKWVTKDCVISAQWADELLLDELRQIAATIIQELSTLDTQNQREAVLSFVYNVGAEAFKRSTMAQFIKVKNWPRASLEFDRWTKDRRDDGIVITLVGLVKRRADEKALFLSKEL